MSIEGPTDERGARVGRGPAHRPSKRAAVIDAAVRVFAERGYADADTLRATIAAVWAWAAEHPAATLQVRTLIRVQIAVLAAITAGGSLDGRQVVEVRAELDRLSTRLMFGA